MSVSEVTTNENTLHEAIRLMNKEEEEKGLGMVDQLLISYPEDVPALHAKACLLLNLEESEEVLCVCDKIQKLINPAIYSNEEYGIPQGFSYMIQAISYLDLERDDQAMESIQTAIKINEIAPYLFVRAIVHIERSQFKDAVKDMMFVFNHPYEGKMMDNSASEIQEIFTEISEVIREINELPQIERKILN